MRHAPKAHLVLLFCICKGMSGWKAMTSLLMERSSWPGGMSRPQGRTDATRRQLCCSYSTQNSSRGWPTPTRWAFSKSHHNNGGSHHQYPEVLSPPAESLVSEAWAAFGFPEEIPAAGVSCWWAFLPSCAIHLPDRQGTREGSSITAAHFTVSTTIYST